jgi:protein-S-isoprenylcysteine O-methyltransferase Ste14
MALGPEADRDLVAGGFFCHLRNPLFLAGTALLWRSPQMTSSRLTFNTLAPAYFYQWDIHEERSLRVEVGRRYEDYRKEIPMYLPLLRCRPYGH